jgi:hypothetical protein
MTADRIQWTAETVLRRPDGGVVFAAEEDGRRFWLLKRRDAGGWPYTLEFCTAEEALAYDHYNHH